MAKKEKSYGEILTAGFIKENPVLRLVLGNLSYTGRYNTGF